MKELDAMTKAELHEEVQEALMPGVPVRGTLWKMQPKQHWKRLAVKIRCEGLLKVRAMHADVLVKWLHARS